MKISTLNSKLHLLSVGSDAKTRKSNEKYPNTITAIMYLASSTLSGYDTCPNASEGCKKVCLISAGHGKLTSVQQARNRKTRLYFEKPEEFKRMKKMLYGSFIKEYDEPGDIARMFLADFFKGINSFEYLEEITTINEQYVEQILNEVFNENKMILSVIKK